MKNRIVALILTISLGVLFTICQGIEYYQANFTFSDSVYGSRFFLATGFHGIHVLIGSIFLIITAKSIISLHNSVNHFVSFDLRA
ncbi:cytochrome c oxidase subunit 3 [Escherichia coli]|nr:cytochrome c oxidase subunit 3 [Escherichia coli]